MAQAYSALQYSDWIYVLCGLGFWRQTLVMVSLGSRLDAGCAMPKDPEPGRSLSVFVADASRIKSQLMVAALQRGRQRIAVVGSAVDSNGIRQGLRDNRADVAVISAELRDGSLAGLDVAREVWASQSLVHVIIMLDFCTPLMVVEAFRAGAHGILSRDDSFEVLCKCIHAVHEGGVWANHEQLHFIIEALAKSAPSHPTNVLGAKLLTQREESLVHLVSQGLTNRDISKQLNLSEHTVRNYLIRIFNKLGTSNRVELALYGIHRSEEASMSSSDIPSDRM
jgi:two-component system, NarL family, nitrate/nitrite response regulator NarL